MGTKNPNRVPDIEGTRDDNTLTIEGEGAAEIGLKTTAGDEVLVERSKGYRPGAPRQDPCEQYGHHPKYYKASDGLEYQVTPRVCRHCNVAY